LRLEKSVYILGVSGFYHDSAAALLRDGRIIAAAQEERFTRIKHDHRLPAGAIEYCLHEGAIEAKDLDYVVFYEKPFLKFDRLLETYFAYAPRGFRQFLMGIPQWLKQKLHIPRELDAALGGHFQGQFVFTGHHESHAASAFFPSPFSEAAVVTLDGVGEWTTASVGIGRDNTVELLYELHFPHSLGLLYSAFTYFSGFKVNSGEYKLMGLAPYGTPVYTELILEKLLDLKADGSFRLNMDYFTYCYTDTMVGTKFETLFGGPRRAPESPLTQREMDIAASIQKVTEAIMLRIVQFAHDKTGLQNLVLAGGVALNCVGNGRILREGPFKNLWIQPAAGDAGGALGAALFVHHQLLENARKVDEHNDLQSASALGPAYSNDEIQSFLDSVGATYHTFEKEDDLLEQIVNDITNGKVVGWFQGRMEFGPRALGSRSIIGDARNEEMQSRMNLKIKFRESFRPFAPSILQDDAGDYFEMAPDTESPYMLLVAPVHDSKRLPLDETSEGLTGVDLLKAKRSVVPGITHVDYSARVQTVDADRHGRYYRLLKALKEKTGCPLVINTSFNIRGEPIVCRPENAYHCFQSTNMDVLVLEDIVVFKDEQPQMKPIEIDAYLARFELD
jgi:carbamoyltransferase